MKYILILITILTLSLTAEAKTTKAVAKPSPTPNTEDVQAYWTALYSKIDGQATTLANQTEEIGTLKTQNATLVENNKQAVAATEEVNKDNIRKDKTILEQATTINKQSTTIAHHKSFARQIALVCAILTVLALGFGLAQFIGRLPQPYSTYGLPILIGIALAGGFIVYTTITVYASRIA